MRDLKKLEQAAIEAVARRFSAAWEKGSGPPDAYIKIGAKRVAVDIRSLKHPGTGRRNTGKPGLRFDKVVTRLTERLQATLSETVPDGMTVLWTITAPIRLPSKTAAALESRIQTLLKPGAPHRVAKATIHGNRIHIRLLDDGSGRAPKMIGFVHNSDTDPSLLLDMTRELLEIFSDEADRRAIKPAGERWLVVRSPAGSSYSEVYRYIYSQFRKAIGFQKILMVFDDGQVETLTG